VAVNNFGEVGRAEGRRIFADHRLSLFFVATHLGPTGDGANGADLGMIVVPVSWATYLYGASASDARNLMATYAIQWEAMQRAKRKGCVEYDLFGIAPNPNPTHPLHGLYRFKSGFGGQMLHRMGCWDYPLKQDEYEAYRSVELTGSGYHLR